MFWIAFILFVLASLLLTFVVLIQEPKQSGLGEGLGGGGGQDFSTTGGAAGGLQRVTIVVGILWGVLAVLLNILPR